MERRNNRRHRKIPIGPRRSDRARARVIISHYYYYHHCYCVWRTTGWNARVHVQRVPTYFYVELSAAAQTRFEIYNNAAQQTSSNKSRVYCANTRNSWSLVYSYTCVCVRACTCARVCFICSRVFPPREFFKPVRPYSFVLDRSSTRNNRADDGRAKLHVTIFHRAQTVRSLWFGQCALDDNRRPSNR